MDVGGCARWSAHLPAGRVACGRDRRSISTRARSRASRSCAPPSRRRADTRSMSASQGGPELNQKINSHDRRRGRLVLRRSTTSSRTARSLPAASSNMRAPAMASPSRPARRSPTSARPKPSSRRCSMPSRSATPMPAPAVQHENSFRSSASTTRSRARSKSPRAGRSPRRCRPARSRSGSSRPTSSSRFPEANISGRSRPT